MVVPNGDTLACCEEDLKDPIHAAGTAAEIMHDRVIHQAYLGL